MTRDDFAGIDAETVSGARVYDYLLGGTDNYAIDRVAADQVEGMLPGTKAMARNSRRFLERVVRYLADERGIRQFIDNGSGLPTADNVHQIAQRLAPDSRVIYVDSDPTVVRHQKVRALAENQNAAFVLSDARDVRAHPGPPADQATYRLRQAGRSVLLHAPPLHPGDRLVSCQAHHRARPRYSLPWRQPIIWRPGESHAGKRSISHKLPILQYSAISPENDSDLIPRPRCLNQ